MRERRIHPLGVVTIVLSAFLAFTGVDQAAQALPPYACGSVTGGSSTVHSHVTDVRVGAHATYDRFVIQFSTARVPRYQITPKSSATFYLDPSDRRVQLLGTAGIKVVVHTATGAGSYFGPTDYRTGFVQLREARRIGDFEGYVSWGLGLAHQSCKRVFTLAGPTRLVIDVPH
jgi:hypothetical protein